jgi:hypothetical protein
MPVGHRTLLQEAAHRRCGTCAVWQCCLCTSSILTLLAFLAVLLHCLRLDPPAWVETTRSISNSNSNSISSASSSCLQGVAGGLGGLHLLGWWSGGGNRGRLHFQGLQTKGGAEPAFVVGCM